jgi:steroid delta-isomerase-like uncharacterized protein
MSPEQHKALIRQYVERLNLRDFAVLDELVADDVVIRSLNRTEQTADVLVGRDAYRAGILRRIEAFPDYRVTIVEMLAEADQVMLYWTNQGTHQGPFRGILPTGKLICEAAISIYRLRDGQIVEVRGLNDNFDFLTQIGVLSSM